jgi:rRNA maturation endonuclease Nob1
MTNPSVPYEPKAFVKIKICLKCGRIAKDIRVKTCPYCSGTLIEKYVRKSEAL